MNIVASTSDAASSSSSSSSRNIFTIRKQQWQAQNLFINRIYQVYLFFFFKIYLIHQI